jgi:biopolymer transport protein ExbB/TolQ
MDAARGSRPNIADPSQRPGQGLLTAFALGLPLATVILWAVLKGPFADTTAHRYLSHPVECVVVIMFCGVVGALVGKVANNLRERRVLRGRILTSWDGKVVPVAEATTLAGEVRKLPRPWQSTYVVRRVRSVLDFLHSRGSAAELDDQLRCLSDQDAMAMEGSNSFVRFITWAMPILGFLGTVLGITGAISGVTPEVLEKSLSTVTDGLALAFDTTALALALTMVTMFCSFLVDRLEQGMLQSVDEFVDRELAHRFARTGDGGVGRPAPNAVTSDSQMLTQMCDHVIRRQAEIWGKALLEIDRRRTDADKPSHEAFTQALSTALEQTLTVHAKRADDLEKKATGQAERVLQQIASLQTEMGRQAELLAGLQEGERQLLRLQESLNRNLEAVSSAGVLEDAVHSLTAAVHLLTARGGSGGAARKAA